jgi:peptidyl-prolyl cis-trans isomerase A (cyclophilin A)
MLETLLTFGAVILLCAFAAPGAAQGADNPVVVIETSKGTITAELDAAKAPISVKNFLAYVDKGHYDNTIFHRVIPGFMIQCGGYATNNRKKDTDRPIKNEGGNGLKNARGTLAMARTGVPDSATSQFFINLADNGFLDRAQSQDGVGYAVFGRVIDGLDVVDEIAKVRTGRGPDGDDWPTEVVVVKSVKRKPAASAAP